MQGSRAHAPNPRPESLRPLFGIRLLWISIACAVVVGCGGGGGGSPPVVQDRDHDGIPDAQDCAPDDPTRWQMLSYQSSDADSDGHFANSSGQVCSGSSLPANYSVAQATDPAMLDCDDNNSSVWRLVTVYADKDGDGVGAGPGQVSCIGKAAPAGFSLLGYDPVDDPSNPNSAAVSDLDLPSWQLLTP